MDSIPTTMSLVGDLVAAALNNNMLSVEMSPLFSRLEPLLLRQFAQMFGLGDRAGGILISGGSLSNLQSLAVARNYTLSAQQQGIASLGKQPVILASEAAHTSLEKAAMVLGLGTSGVVRVATNENAQMRVDALEAAIQQAGDAGKIPFAIAATAGTTATGNIDPLPEIYQVARQYQLWFHVDAVYGGALVFSPQYQHYLNGIENADSVSFNPQKWLYVAKTCSMVLFRDFAGLADTFQIEAPYMQRSPQWWNLGEVSVQGTRHADILKLWLSLQHLGKQGYARLIEGSYQLTAYLVASIRERSYLQLATQPQINVICFRLAGSDRANEQLQKFLLQEYNTFLSLHRYKQKQWLKMESPLTCLFVGGIVSSFERLQPLAILLSATMGLVLSRAGFATQLAEIAIEPLLVAVLYATFLPIPLQQFGRAFRNRSVTLASLVINFVWTPLLAWGLGAFFLANAPDLRLGLLMLLVTPCTDWYLVFTGLAKGDVALGSALLPLNAILQLVLFKYPATIAKPLGVLLYL